ncbi:GNAT family N-acetyltransferase [Tepidiforma sp.]|uniref:GNAT family N-acetyltransferase n=1 Tax=Tepidiforma sp. TaxID=2682230 RepID=UPI002ADD8408|nr:GNAT family N-acetyltransferase [Tepidiforma sp.]
MAERELRLQEVAPRRLDYVVRQLRDPAEIRQLLWPRVEYAAYAIGQLEPDLFPRTRWYLARGTTGMGLVLHSRGGLGDATFVMGDPDAAAAILSIHPGTAQTFATCQPAHVEVLKRVYRLATQQPMIRMSVTRHSFRRAEPVETVPLTGIDIRKINALYSSENGPSYYIPEHIDAGLYRGVVVGGRLVAIAGTHVVSRQEGVAVVGNVFTHPEYRGRGYATAATSAVTERLLEYCDYVVLTVDPRNTPAVAAYTRLGYREACQLVEASATRRDPSGLGSTLRRIRAAMRGRKYDGAFVTLHD